MQGAYLPESETIEQEGMLYVNPQKSLDEQNAFIDALRSTQNQNNAEINTQTANLGTYPTSQSNLGGLTGGEGYFTARYQTPQSTSLAANLRATAQAQALNEVLSNELAMQKQRYNKAYKAAQKRANTPTTPTTPTAPNPTITGDVGENANDNDTLTAQGIGGASRSSKQPAGSTWTTTVRDNYVFTQDQNGKVVNTDHPDYRKASDGYFYRVGQANDAWNNSPSNRAENLSQLEKIRAAAAAQRK